MLHDVDAVLFDLDGTLIDSAPDLGAAADKMRTDRGFESLPLSLYRPMAGAGARGMIAVGFGITPLDANFNQMKDEFFNNYEERLVKNTCAFEGVADMLNQIYLSGLKWGVVTNKAARFTLPITRAMPIFASAGTIVSGDSTPFSKPHPAPLLEAARQLGFSPARCIYVGDDERDIVAGRAAGMFTVAAAYGYLGAESDTANWKADLTIAKPSALLHLLKLV